MLERGWWGWWSLEPASAGAEQVLGSDACAFPVEGSSSPIVYCVIIYYPAACGPKAHGSSGGCFIYIPSPWRQTVIVGPPTTIKKVKGETKETPPRPEKMSHRKEKRNKGKTKGKKEVKSKGGPALPPLPPSASSGGTRSALMHLTLVVRRNSKTASVARPSHRSLTEGARGRSHSHASPISFHNLLACGPMAGTW